MLRPKKSWISTATPPVATSGHCSEKPGLRPRLMPPPKPALPYGIPELTGTMAEARGPVCLISMLMQLRKCEDLGQGGDGGASLTPVREFGRIFLTVLGPAVADDEGLSGQGEFSNPPCAIGGVSVRYHHG